MAERIAQAQKPLSRAARHNTARGWPSVSRLTGQILPFSHIQRHGEVRLHERASVLVSVEARRCTLGRSGSLYRLFERRQLLRAVYRPKSRDASSSTNANTLDTSIQCSRSWRLFVPCISLSQLPRNRQVSLHCPLARGMTRPVTVKNGLDVLEKSTCAMVQQLRTLFFLSSLRRWLWSLLDPSCGRMFRRQWSLHCPSRSNSERNFPIRNLTHLPRLIMTRMLMQRHVRLSSSCTNSAPPIFLLSLLQIL
jgi:hypothetical protein